MGQIAVDDDTRRLRRMIGRGRARCGHSADRDCNAAVNLARWGQIHYQASPEPRTPSNGAGPPMPADGTALTGTLDVPVKPARMTREPTFTPRLRPEPTTPEKGGAKHSPE